MDEFASGSIVATDDRGKLLIVLEQTVAVEPIPTDLCSNAFVLPSSHVAMGTYVLPHISYWSTLAPHRAALPPYS